MNVRAGKIACLVFVLGMAAASSAQTVTTLLNFDIANGGDSFAGLVEGLDGNFYGTSQVGGTSTNCTNGCGTVFQITTAGVITTLHSFNGSDGSGPQGGLVQARNGFLYGTTYAGGTNGDGTVFAITMAGAFTTLHDFGGADGRSPASSLVQGSDGNLYGTTNFGGSNGDGTIFKISPTGSLTTLHSFIGSDGFIPIGSLVQASNGHFYGTTLNGGSHNTCPGGCGTVFMITPAGALTTLHNFNDSDGDGPVSGLIQATDGNLYGTTNFGGTGAGCQTACGTIFKMTPGGKFTTVYDFSGIPYGPYGGLVQGTDDNFYGTTQANAVFSMTPTGTLTTLFTFDFFDGFEPLDPLVQGTDGNFYGTTYQGAEGYGNIFSLSMGLSAFVETRPASGKAGTSVAIVGNHLSSASAVTFNGVAAAFTVQSDTYIRTTVPQGATTGIVSVVTSSGTLNSNVKFVVGK